MSTSGRHTAPESRDEAIAAPAGASIDAHVYAEGPMTDGVRDALACDHVAYVRDFPTDSAERYVAFLNSLGGRPLPNYAAGSRSGAFMLHPVINVVRCAQAGDAARLQERGGPLAMHSARAFAQRRPRWLAMLMVRAGFVDLPERRRGESLIARWRDVLAWQRKYQPETAASDFARLTRTPIRFEPQRVSEPASTLPLLYALADAEEPLDVGGRLTLDMRERLEAVASQIDEFEAYMAAVERLVEAVNDPRVHAAYLMRAGDLVILDNDRFAHGRCDVVCEIGGLLNPRELWSVTIA